MRARSPGRAMGTAPHTPWGGVLHSSPAPPSYVPMLLQVFGGTSTTAHTFRAAQRSCSASVSQGRLFLSWNNPESPAAWGAAKHHDSGVQLPLPDCHWQPLSRLRVPCGQGHQSRRVSVKLSCTTNQRLSLAQPHRNSLRHKAAAAPGCWQRHRARAWAAAGTRRHLHPRH